MEKVAQGGSCHRPAAGKNGNKFDPKGTATRAEVATVLRRFVEIVIDPQTARELAQKNSGKQ